MKLFFCIFCIMLFLNISNAAYYDTLPAGIRNLTYRYIETGAITGSYGSTGDFKGYNVNANINAEALKGINSAVDIYLDSLTPEDKAIFSFGSFQGAATSKVATQVFGGGYGLTNQLTLYCFIPFYSAEVDLKIERTQKGRSNIGTAIQLDNLPDVDVRLIQSLFVNYYNYQPLGKWKANDFGDAELGGMYQLSKNSDGGSMLSFGTVAPTGREDNPDILQDLSFGDGQWDAFIELGAGKNLTQIWSIEYWTRFTYQFAYTSVVRTPVSSVFPVTADQSSARIKLGNKILTNLQNNFKISEQWTTSLLYSLEYSEPTNYQTSIQRSDSILEEDSEKISHIARLYLGYSTLNLYQQKKFFAPVNLNLAFQSILAGKNIPKYERVDFEVRFYY